MSVESPKNIVKALNDSEVETETRNQSEIEIEAESRKKIPKEVLLVLSL